jgi:hypothetical protein
MEDKKIGFTVRIEFSIRKKEFDSKEGDLTNLIMVRNVKLDFVPQIGSDLRLPIHPPSTENESFRVEGVRIELNEEFESYKNILDLRLMFEDDGIIELDKFKEISECSTIEEYIKRVEDVGWDVGVW